MGKNSSSESGRLKKLNKGAWSSQEDEILTNYVSIHGDRKWSCVAKNAGLNRCGKSCRLRWLNYLKPGIKRGDISSDEEELIIRLHRLLGNRWALIAGRLPGRTDNEIKNYWHTILAKKLQQYSPRPSNAQRSNIDDHTSCAQFATPTSPSSTNDLLKDHKSPIFSMEIEAGGGEDLIWDVLNLNFLQMGVNNNDHHNKHDAFVSSSSSGSGNDNSSVSHENGTNTNSKMAVGGDADGDDDDQSRTFKIELKRVVSFLELEDE